MYIDVVSVYLMDGCIKVKFVFVEVIYVLMFFINVNLVG